MSLLLCLHENSSPCRHALNVKYKLETITVNKMLTLKFQAPTPNEML